MNSIIPAQLNEASNGAVFLMTFFFCTFLAFWLINKWRQSRSVHFRTYEVKAVFGLFTMFSGMTAKSGTTWWYLHIRNNGFDGSYPILMPVFVLGTLIMLWGMVCLMRSLLPTEYGKSRWIWLALFALAFGIFFSA